MRHRTKIGAGGSWLTGYILISVAALNRNYDCGHVENVISVNVNTYMDVEITFHHTFNSIPAVSPILLANTTGDTPLKIKAIVVKNSVSKTGCTIRIFNYNSIGIGIYLDWIAISR